MKKIIISLAVIGVVSAVVIGGTIAYFSDTESNSGNTFSAGTIDISIGDENNGSWIKTYDVGDLKPGETGYINFRINNVGQNPVNISKTLTSIQGNSGTKIGYTCGDLGVSSEPEFLAEGGTIDTEGCDATKWVANDDVQSQIIYDLSVKVYADDGATEPMWWQTIYSEDDGMSIANVYGLGGGTPVELGMIPVGGYMLVTQSYHFDYNAGNQYQGDGLTFGIKIEGKQLTGDDSMATVTLANKTKVGNDWIIDQSVNGFNAVLTYSTKGPEFVYNLNGKAPLSDHDYVLAIGKKVNGSGYDVDTFIADVHSDVSTGNVSVSGSININKDMTDVKVWLVPSENWTSGAMDWSTWDACVPNFLWETGMIWYEDTDL